MRTHGDYRAQIDKILGRKTPEPRPDTTKDKEIAKLKKELKREKQMHSKYRAMYTEKASKGPGEQ